MISDVNEAAKEANHVSEVCKIISVYDAIINLITAWEKVQPKTIVKCFKKCGIPSQSTDTEINEIDEVEINSDIVDMPWDELMQWEGELAATDSCVEPDNIDHHTDQDPWVDDSTEAKEESTNMPEPIMPPSSIDETIRCICGYRKECLDNPELFELMNALYTKLQSRKLKMHIAKNNKQRNITAFFVCGLK